MDIDIKLDQIDHDDLLALHDKVKNYIATLENEIETSEVEKKSNG